MSKTRPYKILHAGQIVGLVNAATAAQAVGHHTAGLYAAMVATPAECHALGLAGISMAHAGRGDEPPIPTLTDPIDDGHDGSEQ